MNAMQSLFAVAAIVGMPLALVVAYDRPPADARPLVEIVEQLEREGYGPLVDIEFDDGYWEIEAYEGDSQYELAVDPRSGKVRSKERDDAEPRPPRDAQPLSKLLRQLAKAGHARIEEVSFERRYWEIESLRDDGKHEIHVHPATGEIIKERLDD